MLVTKCFLITVIKNMPEKFQVNFLKGLEDLPMSLKFFFQEMRLKLECVYC